MPVCEVACRQQLAQALCAALQTDVTVAPITPPTVQLHSPSSSMPLLRSRRHRLWRELECSADTDASVPPLRGKQVENGKSGSAFLVPGGRAVDPVDSATFSVILKQLSKQETLLLQQLHTDLLHHYQRPHGSLLVPIVTWLTYTADDGSDPFHAVVLDNAAQRPAGLGSAHARTRPAARALQHDAVWKPFDMKGIRLYAHERRYASHFGERGLWIGHATHERLRRMTHADSRFLADRQLVDFSYLVSVFRTSGEVRRCDELSQLADYMYDHAAAGAGRTQGVVPAVYRVPRTHAAADGGDGGVPVERPDNDHARHTVAEMEEGGSLCVPVMVRVAVIDYLRAWNFAERFEHIQKTLSRDLLAGERNHAVLPVRQFAEQFERFFDQHLFAPLPVALPLLKWRSPILFFGQLVAVVQGDVRLWRVSGANLSQWRWLPTKLVRASARAWGQLAHVLIQKARTSLAI